MSTRLERIAERIHQAVPELTGVERAFGALEVKKHGAKRRVVWSSPGGNVDAAKRTSGTVTDESGAPQRIKITGYRVEDVQVHIYGEDSETAEALLDAVIAGIRLVLGDNAPYPWPYGWHNESQDAGAHNMRPKILLEFTANMPVSEEALGLRNIAQFVHGHTETNDLPHTNPH